ncbi:MAG: beta-propeller fold lactonase family protein, partial [Rhizobiales bacterium]|nr:beta-propeller fold lactonase family protein [Hyphomicrobiales bacterium]
MTKQETTFIAYAGGYAPNSQNVKILHLSAKTGELLSEATGPKIENPSWLTISHNKRFLYIASETASPQGRIHSYAIHAISGALTLISNVASGGALPGCLSEHP